MSTTRCNRFNSSSRSRLSRSLSGFALCRYESRRIYRVTTITAGRVLNTSLEDTAAVASLYNLNIQQPAIQTAVDNPIAGTPILMADGTTKPIEQIHHGDMVFAVDHNDPEHDTVI